MGAFQLAEKFINVTTKQEDETPLPIYRHQGFLEALRTRTTSNFIIKDVLARHSDTPMIPALEMWRQEERELKASLCYMRSYPHIAQLVPLPNN